MPIHMLPGVDQVLKDRKGGGMRIVEAPAGSLTTAELIVSGGTGRDPTFCKRDGDENLPPGSSWIPFAPQLSANKGGTVAAVIDDLATRYGLKAQAGENFRGSVLEHLKSHYEINEENIASLRGRLETSIDSGKPCPYLAFRLPENSEARSAIMEEIFELSGQLPELPIVVLSGQEEKDTLILGGFHYLLPKKDDDDE